MTYRPSRRRSLVTSSARWSSRPTRHCNCDDAVFDDGLATRTSTITYQSLHDATKTLPNATETSFLHNVRLRTGDALGIRHNIKLTGGAQKSVPRRTEEPASMELLSCSALGLPNPYFGLTNLRTTESSEQKAVNVVVGLTNLLTAEPAE